MNCHNEYQPSIAPRRIPMAATVCAIAAALAAYHPVAGAQQADDAAAPPIIVFAPEHAAGASANLSALTAEQAATLETIRSDPAASGIRLGRSASAAIAAVPAERAFSIPVPAPSASGVPPSGASPETADAVLAFTGVDVEHSSSSPADGEDLVSFYARDDATDSEVALVVQGPDVLGSIRRGAEVYKVHPLGGGLTAVYRYDTSQLRRHPPGWWRFMRRRNESMRRQTPQSPAASGAAADTGDEIDIMVAYTPAARAAARNIDTFIQFAIDNAHRIYRNSGIGFRLRLVHKHQVSYTEHPNMGMDLDRLTDVDGMMDEVHSLRDRYGADLVALIVGRSRDGTCGIAWVPDFGAGPDLDWSEQGFSVTAHNCETATLHTFAHELGHNLGAHHDPDNTCESPPCRLDPPPTFPYRYGRCNTDEGWHTVMSYGRSRTRGDCGREIEYFSSPILNFRGTPTGDAARRDNRRVLRETAQRVANYRQSVNTGGGTSHVLPYVLAERTAGRQGFVRIVNRSARAGTVTLTAIDDAGRTAGTETLDLAANGAIHFNSRDLESGNAAKGFSGVGPGAGDWRLTLTSALDIQPLAYVRTNDGFVTRIDDIEAEAEEGANRYVVHFFNPGRNRNQRSYLRLINPGTASARITIEAHDDTGAQRGPVSLDLPAGQARPPLTVGELETGGGGFDGRLGTGSGKWRLTVTATRPVQVMSLLQTLTGHLTNLSNYRPTGGGTRHELPYVLAEGTAGRQGFVRIVNRSARAGTVTLTAIDDAGRTAGTETLDLAANGAIHFNSRDLESGNAAKGFSGVGPGAGDWRLTFTSALDIQPLAYVRTNDGFVTRIDDVEAEAEEGANRYVVHFFNPGRNRNQRSYLRLINPGAASARITIEAHDDAGARRGPVSLDLPAGQARRLTAGELETGGGGFNGRLGTGSGKWRLTVTATRPVQVMSLLQTPTGHLTNLSGVPAMQESR